MVFETCRVFTMTVIMFHISAVLPCHLQQVACLLSKAQACSCRLVLVKRLICLLFTSTCVMQGMHSWLIACCTWMVLVSAMPFQCHLTAQLRRFAYLQTALLSVLFASLTWAGRVFAKNFPPVSNMKRSKTRNCESDEHYAFLSVNSVCMHFHS